MRRVGTKCKRVDATRRPREYTGTQGEGGAGLGGRLTAENRQTCVRMYGAAAAQNKKCGCDMKRSGFIRRSVRAQTRVVKCSKNASAGIMGGRVVRYRVRETGEAGGA